MRLLRFAIVVVMLSVSSVAKADQPTFESCACFQEQWAYYFGEYLTCYTELDYLVSEDNKDEFIGLNLTMHYVFMGTSFSWGTFSLTSEKSKPPKGKAELACSWSMLTPVVDDGAIIEGLSKFEYTTCPDYYEYLYTLALNQGQCSWVE